MSWDSGIFDAQQRIADLLNADTFINDANLGLRVPVVTRREGNIAQKVAESLGKPGIIIVVMLPRGDFSGRESKISLAVTFAIVIKETPVVNQTTAGTNKPAEVLIPHVMAAVHWQPNSANDRSGAVAGKFLLHKNAVQLLRPQPGDAPLNYAVSVTTNINIIKPAA